MEWGVDVASRVHRCWGSCRLVRRMTQQEMGQFRTKVGRLRGRDRAGFMRQR